MALELAVCAPKGHGSISHFSGASERQRQTRDLLQELCQTLCLQFKSYGNEQHEALRMYAEPQQEVIDEVKNKIAHNGDKFIKYVLRKKTGKEFLHTCMKLDDGAAKLKLLSLCHDIRGLTQLGMLASVREEPVEDDDSSDEFADLWLATARADPALWDEEFGALCARIPPGRQNAMPPDSRHYWLSLMGYMPDPDAEKTWTQRCEMWFSRLGDIVKELDLTP